MSVTNLVQPTPASGEVIMITPEIASSMLAKNTHNRNARAAAVSAYAVDMRNGDWRWTGDPIRFAADGTLIDGQHRLMAIVEAGVTLPFLVLSGLEASAQENIDGGVPRKFADVLALRGEECSALLAAVIRLATAWENGQRRTIGHAGKFTNAQYLRTLEAHPELRRFAHEHARTISNHVQLPGSLVAFCWWLFASIDEEDAADFFARLGSEVGHEKGEPIFELRRTLANNAESTRGERSRTWMIAVTIKAWNAYRRGDSVGLYRFRTGGAKPEAFPEPS